MKPSVQQPGATTSGGRGNSTPVHRTKRSPTPKGKNVRISNDLFELAERHANVAQRSIQKQIEYWSHLGRLLEMSLSNRESYKLLSHESHIAEILFASATVPSADAVMEEIELSRLKGTLQSQVTQAQTVYDLAEDGRSIRQTCADGSVKQGSLIDGIFVESNLNP